MDVKAKPCNDMRVLKKDNEQDHWGNCLLGVHHTWLKDRLREHCKRMTILVASLSASLEAGRGGARGGVMAVYWHHIWLPRNILQQ